MPNLHRATLRPNSEGPTIGEIFRSNMLFGNYNTANKMEYRRKLDNGRSHFIFYLSRTAKLNLVKLPPQPVAKVLEPHKNMVVFYTNALQMCNYDVDIQWVNIVCFGEVIVLLDVMRGKSV